jgi:hypothetical protein
MPFPVRAALLAMLVLGATAAPVAAWTPVRGGLQRFALGAEGLVEAAGADIMVVGYSVPACADWNSDGLFDLVVGEGGGEDEGKVRIYLNVGTAGQPLFDDEFYAQTTQGVLTVEQLGCQGAFPRVVQWDDDGRKDLLVGLGDGRVMLFTNRASDQDPLFDQGAALQVGPIGGKVDLDVGDRAASVVADWNSDGRKDLVVGGLDGAIHLFLNTGSDSAPNFEAESYAESSGGWLIIDTWRSSPAVADLTEDGRKDLLVGETEGQLLLCENIGSDQAPLFDSCLQVASDGVPIDLASTRSRPALCDFDGDGLDDVLIGSSDGMVRLYRNLGALFADDFESGNTSQWSFTVGDT